MDTTYKHQEIERQLMKDVALENIEAFERLYKLFERRVYQYVCTIVLDYSDAEDIVIETMTAVWRGAGTYAQTSSVSTWIFGIARHKALDALRRQSARHQIVPLDDAAELPDHHEGPMDTLNRTQMAALTKKALTRLSFDHQEILRLVFHEEMPYDEIATLLSIPENTVKTRVYHAKRQLKLQMNSLGHGGVP